MMRIMDNLHEDICTFATSGSILLRIRDISDKTNTENQNTHFIFSIFWTEQHSWDNVVKQSRDMTI